jgi:hypothetical protein
MHDDNHTSFDLFHLEPAVLALATQLAHAVLAGNQKPPELRKRLQRVLGRNWPWLTQLIRQIRLDFGDGISPAEHDELLRSILAYPPLRRAFESDGEVPCVRGWYPFVPPMGAPPPRLGAIELPALATPGDLADWLGLRIGEMDWFAGSLRPQVAANGPLWHYSYRWLAKRCGGYRLIEVPKPRLRNLQRRILRNILERVPVHVAAHGCVRGRSAVSAALPHTAADVLLQIDLRDFFSSVTAGRVHAVFRTLGYPPSSARLMTGLTTHATPRSVLRAAPVAELTHPGTDGSQMRRHALLTVAHLPQGAPSSPALANLCAYRLDVRLSGAAAACGVSYTRYVDDLIFSGDLAFARKIERFKSMVYSIIVDEGFEPHFQKTRTQTQAAPQHVVGLVVNRKLNVPRREFDALKALLHNCRCHGPSGQNRHAHPMFRQHLLGRIARVAQVNPARGARLMREFRSIDWA